MATPIRLGTRKPPVEVAVKYLSTDARDSDAALNIWVCDTKPPNAADTDLWIPSSAATTPEYVTVLPTTGLFDGKEVYYVASASQGVVWHLRYNANSSSAYKWEYLGGAPMENHFNEGTGIVTNPGTFTTLGGGLSPGVAGDFDFEVTAKVAETSAYYYLVGGPSTTTISGLTPADRPDSAFVGTSSASQIGGTILHRRRSTLTSSAGNFAGFLCTNGGSSGSWYATTYRLTPVRVI